MRNGRDADAPGQGCRCETPRLQMPNRVFAPANTDQEFSLDFFQRTKAAALAL